MARSYAHIYLTIWNDPDFRSLSPDGQWLYFVMLTHPTITSCGVIEWREAKLINLTDGMTIERLRQAAWELAQRRMVAVDVETEEALIRSFVRHDGALKVPNQAKALVREHAAIASLKIMELVSREVRRATEENPEWKGCEEVAPVAKQFLEPIQKGFEWVPEWFQSRSISEGSKKGEPFQLRSPVPNPQPLTPSTDVEGVQGETNTEPPASGASAADAPDRRKRIDDDFEDWWQHYPRKVAKGQALKAYRAARKKTDHDTLVEAILGQAPAITTQEKQFQPHGSTWLNGERWLDEPATTTADDDPWIEPAQPPAEMLARWEAGA